MDPRRSAPSEFARLSPGARRAALISTSSLSLSNCRTAKQPPLASRQGVGEPYTGPRTGWPKNPRALVGRLRRAQTFLRALGIDITFSREGRAGSRIN